MKQNNVISSAVYLAMLKAKQKDPYYRADLPILIQGDLDIDGEQLGVQHIHLEQVTTTGSLMIRNSAPQKGAGMISLEACNFLGGLRVENVDISHIIMSDVRAKWINLWRCKAISADLREIVIDDGGVFDMSGLELQRDLSLTNITYTAVELFQRNVFKTITTGFVQTNDPVLALQFRMAGIPVYITTKTAQEMLTDPARLVLQH